MKENVDKRVIYLEVKDVNERLAYKNYDLEEIARFTARINVTRIVSLTDTDSIELLYSTV